MCLPRLGKAGSFLLKFFHNALDFFFSQVSHEIQRSLFESQGYLTAEVQIIPGPDSPINDIKGLRKQDAQQSVPDLAFNFIVYRYVATRAMSQPAIHRTQNRRRFVVVTFFHLK